MSLEPEDEAPGLSSPQTRSAAQLERPAAGQGGQLEQGAGQQEEQRDASSEWSQDRAGGENGVHQHIESRSRRHYYCDYTATAASYNSIVSHLYTSSSNEM